MARESERIDGWKAIGGHFGRDRSTAIRWASERNLPIHRVPGGKTATVYAFKEELNAWLRNQQLGGHPDDTEPADNSRSAPFSRSIKPATPWKLWLAGCAVAVVVVIVAVWLPTRPSTSHMPHDEEVARLYVEARDNWAQRTAPSLDRAIRGLQAVAARDNTFALAYAGLADAYLLSAEYGSLSREVSYARAKQAAERALKLDPDLAEAHRALGFIRYWWERDPAGAGQSFRRALTLAPSQAQTHFWYANVLIDNGEQAAGMREFDAARLGDPGSVPIQVDHAWARWSGGDVKTATAQLREILQRHPETAVAHDCLGVIALGQGDYSSYVRELVAREQLRAEPGLRAFIPAIENALSAGHIAEVQRLILTRALSDEENAPFPDHAWAAFVANAAKDRVALIRILRLAETQKQRWGSAGYVRRIAERWQSDSEIMALLKARATPKILTQG